MKQQRKKKRAYRNRLDEEQRQAARIKDAEKKAFLRAREKEINLLLSGNLFA